jgi:polysaccharide export outer membrane protein
MKFKNWGYFFFFLVIIIFTSSCISSKKVPYFRSERKGEIVDIPSYRLESTVRFRPDDILGITVNVPGEPNVSSDYNLPLVPIANTENSTEDLVNPGMGRQTFLINKDGTIDFPVLGTIKVAGYTQAELEKYLHTLLSEKLVEHPVVTVRLLNFKITVTGEVANPGFYTVSSDHISVVEALALAGDMTIYGRRDDIVLMRTKPDGTYTKIPLNINKEDIISSPYFFLQQNDILYVTPNNARAQTADISPQLSVAIGMGSFVMSLVTFVLMLSKK